MKKIIISIMLYSLVISAQEKWFVWDAPRLDIQKPYLSFYGDNLYFLSLDGMFFKSDHYFNSREYSFFTSFEVDQTYQPVSKKNFLFVDENIGFFIFKTDQIYKTIDGGKTWILQNNLTGNIIEYTKDGVLFLFDKYVYKSYDKGETWIKLPANYTYFDYGDPIDVFAIDSLNIWVIKKQEPGLLLPLPKTINCYTTDGGKTWNKFNENMINSFKIDYFSIMFNEEGIGFISGLYYSVNTSKYVYFILKSTDKGRTWEFSDKIDELVGDIFYQDGEWIFFLEYESGYYLSKDDLTTTPERKNTHYYYRKYYNPEKKLLHTITWDEFLINTGNFESINDYQIKCNINPDIWIKYDHQTNSALVYKSNESNQFLFERDRTDYKPVQLDSRFLSYDRLQFLNKTFYSAFGNKLLYLSNYGNAPLNIISLNTNFSDNPKYTVYPNNSFFAITESSLYSIENSIVRTASPFSKEIKISSLLQYDTDKLLATGNYKGKAGFLRTEDGAKSWSFVEEEISFSTLKKFNDTTFLATNGSNIFVSHDFGLTWNSIYKEVYDNYIHDFNIYNNSTLLLSTSNGIKIFDMISSEILSEFSVNPFFKSFKSVYLINDNLIIGKTKENYLVKITDFELELPEKTTDNLETDNQQETIAKEIQTLSQNYPNPFNPKTSIEYTIPDVGTRHGVSVLLKVYDVLGNEIQTLVNENKSAGTYRVDFDGSELPSGIYIYRLQAGNVTEFKKMILLK